MTIQRLIYGQGSAKPAGTIDERWAALDRPDEYGCGETCLLRDDIEAMIHPINQIDVRASGRPKKHLGPFGASFRGMTGEVVLSDIGLHLEDATGTEAVRRFPHQVLPKKLHSNGESGAIKKRNGEDPTGKR